MSESGFERLRYLCSEKLGTNVKTRNQREREREFRASERRVSEETRRNAAERRIIFRSAIIKIVDASNQSNSQGIIFGVGRSVRRTKSPSNRHYFEVPLFLPKHSFWNLVQIRPNFECSYRYLPHPIIIYYLFIYLLRSSYWRP